MTISDRTRKILWVKAGGRCSICRVQLVTEGTEVDDPSVFGEEAHIVGKGKNGPRSRATASDIDSYDNLILLCRKHHKQIDDQVGHYTVERLNSIKREHEDWIKSFSESKMDNGPVRLVPDPTKPVEKNLKLFLNGSKFWHFVDGARGFYPSWVSGLSDEDEDRIAHFLDDLRDWIDICSDVDSFTAKRDAARALGEHIKELAEAGFFVGARERFMLLTGGIDEQPWPWRVLDIEVQPVADAQVVDGDGTPLDTTPHEPGNDAGP